MLPTDYRSYFYFILFYCGRTNINDRVYNITYRIKTRRATDLLEC